MLHSPVAVGAYQAEFDEMFERRSFGPRSEPGTVTFTEGDVPVQILFAPEDDVIDAILAQIEDANSSVHFMAFSFTRDDMGQAMLDAAARGVTVRGLFELRGSETRFSELTPLLCAGLDVRQDGNNASMHHKVVVVDKAVVMTGSFNFSNNATESNDENIVILRDPTLAALYIAEFERLFADGAPPPPGDIVCDA